MRKGWKQCGLCLLFIASLFVRLTGGVLAQGTEPNLNAQAAIAIDGVNGQILYEKNGLALLEVGNLTKLLSLLVLYDALDQERLSLEEMIDISDQAYALSQNYNLANVPLRQDYQYSVKELLEAVQIGSANGALLALAEHLSGSQEAFQGEMKTKLEEILADNQAIAPLDQETWQSLQPQLVSITGLSQEEMGQTASNQENRLNALILATISYQLLSRHPEILEQTRISQKLFREGTNDQFEMQNSNQMLLGQAYEYPEVDGLMTATTRHDGTATVQTLVRDQLRIIVISLGNSDSAQSYQDSKRLFDYVLATYQSRHIVSRGERVTQVPTLVSYNGNPQEVNLFYGEDLQLVVPIIDTSPKIDYDFIADTSILEEIQGRWNLPAPQAGGSIVGNIQASIKDYNLRFVPTSKSQQVPVQLSQDVEEIGTVEKVFRGIGRFFAELGEAIRKFFTNLFN